MKTTETALSAASMKLGAWLFLCGVFILGPLGFVLLGGLAYAMHFSNLALGVVCILLLASPLILLAVWVPLMGAAYLMERAAAEGTLAAESRPVE
ncbi:MAG: hypothetical protein LDL33_05295 [Desulfomonile sp.]|nr:hypothetical protein [Desulfomonile sp.]